MYLETKTPEHLRSLKAERGNSTMINLVNSVNNYREQNPQEEVIKEGPLRGIDVLIAPALVVLNHLGVKTIYSCQGNHIEGMKNGRLRSAYILAPAGSHFPSDLVARLERDGFFLSEGPNYETYEKSPGKYDARVIPGVRQCLYAETYDGKTDGPARPIRELWEKNERFLLTLARWATEILAIPELESLVHYQRSGELRKRQ